MGNSASLPSLESIGRPFGTERPPTLSLRRHAERQTQARGPVERLEREVEAGGRRRTRKQEENDGRRGSRGARPEELRAERAAEDRPTRRAEEADGRSRSAARRSRLDGGGRELAADPTEEPGSFGSHLKARTAAREAERPAQGARRAATQPEPTAPQTAPPTPLQVTPSTAPAPAGHGPVGEAPPPAAAATARGQVQAAAPAEVRPAAREGARPVSEAKAPAPSPEPGEAQEARRATQVLQQLRMHLHPGLRSATVQLNPAELGRLAIRVSVEEGGVVARVAAESEEALAVLQRHVPELEAAFADQGFEEMSFEFVLDQHAGGETGEEGESRDLGRALERRLEEDPVHQHLRRAASNGVGVDTYA